MALCLSALTRLESFMLKFYSPDSFPVWERQRPSPQTCTLLPTLIWLEYSGIDKYLEDLVDRIDFPVLGTIILRVCKLPYSSSLTRALSQRTRRVYLECNYAMQSMLSRCWEEVQALRRKICPASTQLCFISYMAVPSSFMLNGEENAMGFEIFPNNHIPVSCGTCYVIRKSGTCICSDAYLDTVQTLVRIAQTIWHRQHTRGVTYWTSSGTRPSIMYQRHASTLSKTVYNTTVYCISLLDSQAVMQVPLLILDHAIIWPIDVLTHSSVFCHTSCNRISRRPITSL